MRYLFMIHIRVQRIHYAPGYVMPEHVDGHRRLSILLSGTLAEQDATCTEHASPFSVGLKAPRFAHISTFGLEGTTILSLLLPESVLRGVGLRTGDVAPWRWHHASIDRAAALALAVALVRAEAPAAARMLPGVLDPFRRATDTPPPPALLALRGRLERRAAAPPDTTHLAEELGMHAVSLGRAFRRHFGCSMTRFRQRVRVAHAALEVTSTDTPVTHIALDHGFSDVSHMTRLFRRELGACPVALRQLLRAATRRGPAAQPRGRGLESFKTEWSLPL